MKWIISALLLLSLALPALADEPAAVSMVDLLSGKVVPVNITGKDLADGGWFRFAAGGTEGAGAAMMQQLAGNFGIAGVFYTQGKMVAVGAVRYLVAYTRPNSRVDMRAMMERGELAPPPEPITMKTVLPLSLLDMRAVGSLKDIRAVDPSTELITDKAALNLYEQARMKALQNTSMNNLRQIAIAASMFIQDNDETFPPMTDAATFRKALKAYDGNDKLWLQPLVDEPYQPNPALSKKALGDIAKPDETVLVYEAKSWPDGTRCVAFVDGHVELMDDARWKQVKAKAGIK